MISIQRQKIEQVIKDDILDPEDVLIEILRLVLADATKRQGNLYAVDHETFPEHVIVAETDDLGRPKIRVYVREQLHDMLREALDESDMDIYIPVDPDDPDDNRINYFVELFYDGLDSCELFPQVIEEIIR